MKVLSIYQIVPVGTIRSSVRALKLHRMLRNKIKKKIHRDAGSWQRWDFSGENGGRCVQNDGDRMPIGHRNGTVTTPSRTARCSSYPVWLASNRRFLCLIRSAEQLWRRAGDWLTGGWDRGASAALAGPQGFLLAKIARARSVLPPDRGYSHLWRDCNKNKYEISLPTDNGLYQMVIMCTADIRRCGRYSYSQSIPGGFDRKVSRRYDKVNNWLNKILSHLL